MLLCVSALRLLLCQVSSACLALLAAVWNLEEPAALHVKRLEPTPEVISNYFPTSWESWEDKNFLLLRPLFSNQLWDYVSHIFQHINKQVLFR